MKPLFYLLFLFVCVFPAACQNPAHKKAQKTANAIQKAMKKYAPPEVVTSSKGYTMRAVVDGKPWEASNMMEINKSNTHFIQGSNGEIRIAFYIYRTFIKVGKHLKMTGADLDFGNGNLLKAKTGEYVLTKANDKVIEGTFHFTASPYKSDETMEVTNGFFRVLLKQ